MATNNNNGFADALEQIKTVASVNQQVAKENLKDAAEYFAKKLRENIPLGPASVHLKEEVKVVVYPDYVSVQFSDKGWYWHLADKGHKKSGGKGRVKGLHFSRNTISREKAKIEQILLQNIINQI